MKILHIESSNVKRLRVVDITPDPTSSTVIIGGQNGAGKSSVLDSIMYALGGKSTLPADPIRHGADKATITLTLDDYVVTRKFTESDSYLTVTDRKGGKISSAQTLLDKLVGGPSFDPQAFIRLSPKEQSKQLAELVGLDFSPVDTERKEEFEARRDVNQSIKRLEGSLATMTFFVDAPATPQDSQDVLKELNVCRDHNRKAIDLQDELKRANRNCEENTRQIALAELKIADLQRQLVVASETFRTLKGEGEQLESKRQATLGLIQAHTPMDETQISLKLTDLETINTKVRNNAEYKRRQGEVTALKDVAQNHTDRINQLDEFKIATLGSAKFPVAGLGFGSGKTKDGEPSDDTVYYQGVPLAQASSAEQLRVSVAMGLAINPTLRILLLRDASLLDDSNMAMISQMAAEANAQVWLERVGEHDANCIVIEDGTVRLN